MRKILFYLLTTAFLVFPITATAQYERETFIVDDIEYTVVSSDDDGASVEITRSVGFYSGKLVIPAEVNYSGRSYKIVSIKEEAFFRSSITELDLRSATHLKYIGTKSFAENKTMLDVYFPPFENSSLVEIAPLAFQHCIGIHHFNLEDTHIEVLESIFSYSENDEVSLDFLRELSLPPTLKEIKRCALQFLGIQSITFPSSITTIGDRVLEGNIYLKEFIWRDAQVTSIPRDFFLGDDALENVTILTVEPMEEGGLSDLHFFMCHPDLLTVTVSQPSFEILANSTYNPDYCLYSTFVYDPTYVPSGIVAPQMQVAGRQTDGVIYTLQGVRVSQPRKGELYIQNGKKFVK